MGSVKKISLLVLILFLFGASCNFGAKKHESPFTNSDSGEDDDDIENPNKDGGSADDDDDNNDSDTDDDDDDDNDDDTTFNYMPPPELIDYKIHHDREYDNYSLKYLSYSQVCFSTDKKIFAIYNDDTEKLSLYNSNNPLVPFFSTDANGLKPPKGEVFCNYLSQSGFYIKLGICKIDFSSPEYDKEHTEGGECLLVSSEGEVINTNTKALKEKTDMKEYYRPDFKAEMSIAPSFENKSIWLIASAHLHPETDIYKIWRWESKTDVITELYDFETAEKTIGDEVYFTDDNHNVFFDYMTQEDYRLVEGELPNNRRCFVRRSNISIDGTSIETFFEGYVEFDISGYRLITSRIKNANLIEEVWEEDAFVLYTWNNKLIPTKYAAKSEAGFMMYSDSIYSSAGAFFITERDYSDNINKYDYILRYIIIPESGDTIDLRNTYPFNTPGWDSLLEGDFENWGKWYLSDTDETYLFKWDNSGITETINLNELFGEPIDGASFSKSEQYLFVVSESGNEYLLNLEDKSIKPFSVEKRWVTFDWNEFREDLIRLHDPDNNDYAFYHPKNDDIYILERGIFDMDDDSPQITKLSENTYLFYHTGSVKPTYIMELK